MRRHQVLNLGRWRLSFWRGPTKLGAHTSSRTSGAAGLGLFGVNWIRRNRQPVSVRGADTPGEDEK